MFSFHKQSDHGSDEKGRRGLGRKRSGVVANKQGDFHMFT